MRIQPGLDGRLFDFYLAENTMDENGERLVSATLPVFETTRFTQFIRTTLKEWDFTDLNLAPPYSDFFMERVSSRIDGVPVVLGARIKTQKMPSGILLFKNGEESGEAGWAVTFKIFYPSIFGATTLRDAYREYLNYGFKGNEKWKCEDNKLKNFPFSSPTEIERNVEDAPDWWLQSHANDIIYDFISPSVEVTALLDTNGMVKDVRANGFSLDRQKEYYEGDSFKFFGGLVFPFALAISYLNNPGNIEKIGPNRHDRKRSLLSGEHLNSVYYVLKVPYFEKYLRENPALDSISSVRLHMRRGSWATYTPEAPLFGRLIGKVFRSSCIAGKRELGVIKKDYQIEPSRAEIF